MSTIGMHYKIDAEIWDVDEAVARNIAADIIMLCSMAVESEIAMQNVIAGAVIAAHILCADDADARKNLH